MRSLEDVRVLDLSRLLPGPFATLVLSDLGATVDKVEDPDLGDYLRHAPPHVGGTSVPFHTLNRGKRSLVMDLKSPLAAATFKRLVKNYDVVFDQFRPGVMDRLGIGHGALLEEFPRLVICALTGYGQTGPLRDRAGHDLNYLSRAGLMGLMGPPDRPPQLPSFQLADVGGGLWSVIAILAALRERDQTGRGQILDIGMSDAVVPFATIALARAFGGEVPERGGEYLTGGIAAYNSYFTKDGEAVTLGALEPKFLQRFCKAADIPFDAMAIVPGPHQQKIKAEYAEVFAKKTRDEWAALGEAHDCCLEPVLRPEELANDPHLRARGVFADAESNGVPFLDYRTPITDRAQTPKTAPKTAEHTDVVLLEAGFSKAEILELRNAGAIR
jgi:alpha-methylacyl-CoA racemase